MNRKLEILLWSLSSVILTVTVLILARSGTGREPPRPPQTASSPEDDLAARVGDYTISHSSIALLRLGDGAVEQWVNDQMLACAALQQGLENPAVSRFLEQRARQLYLRDLMLQEISGAVPQPSHDETWARMRFEPELFLVERHYHHIIAADSAMADSIHHRLATGQNFDVMARNLSLGQKAGIGGDLGYATGAQMQVQGFPLDVALLDGLGNIIESSLGWHIFMVSDARALEDSVRAFESAQRLIYDRRLEAAVDSLLQVTSERLSMEVYL